MPPFFPLTEDTFFLNLSSRFQLDGIAGDLSVMAKASRTDQDGNFFRFEMNENMKKSQEARQYILRYTIHKVTVLSLIHI